MVLPSGVTRLAGSDTTDPAGLRGTVSVLEIRGPSGQQTHQFSMGGDGAVNIAMRNSGAFGQVVSIPVTVRVQPGVHDGAYAMTALQQALTFLSAGWRQAAADDAADSGFWNAVAGPR